MAKKAVKKSAAPAKQKPASKRSAKSPAAKRTAKPKASSSSRPQKPESAMSASDALVGLIESPLVADVLAAGAAAALASFTHHRLTRRRDSNSKVALKDAAKAAATAMGARLSEEFDEILESANRAKRGEG
jgi:hypothetical protein